MADTNLTRRIAELETEIARLKAEATTSRPIRRRLNGKLTDRKQSAAAENCGRSADGAPTKTASHH